MADPAPAPDPAPDPEIDPAHQAQFNKMFESAIGAYLEKNKPAPEKTPGRPGGITEWLLGTGKSGS